MIKFIKSSPMKTPKIFIFLLMSFFTITFSSAQNPSDGCVDLNQIDSSVMCNFIYNPVCGCDGVNYGNDCEAENYGGVTSFTWGVCSSDTIPEGCIDSSLIDNNVACIEIYDPVCGCDGVTYSNDCVAENYHGISSYVLGECDEVVNPPGSCIDSNLIDPSIYCTTNYKPVCGCDGITYSNGCIAAVRFGITNYTIGECTSVSIKDELNFKTSIYPNPTNHFLNILFENKPLNQSFNIQLIDLNGKTILSKENFNALDLTIPLHDISNGIYLLKISSNFHSQTNKIIINK